MLHITCMLGVWLSAGRGKKKGPQLSAQLLMAGDTPVVDLLAAGTSSITAKWLTCRTTLSSWGLPPAPHGPA